MSLTDFLGVAGLLGVVATLFFLYRQLELQRKALLAQLTMDWFQLYWETLSGPAEGEIENARLNPDEWMGEYKRKYLSDPDALARYVDYARTYEFLALTHSSFRSNLSLPFGVGWFDEWIYVLSKAQEFHDVDDHYRKYYPDFHAYIADLLGRTEGK